MAYVSHSIFDQLIQQDIQLVITVKSKLKNKLMLLRDKLLLLKRCIIKTINNPT